MSQRLVHRDDVAGNHSFSRFFLACTPHSDVHEPFQAADFNPSPTAPAHSRYNREDFWGLMSRLGLLGGANCWNGQEQT